MDLQVSVFLLLALSTAGHALSCYECSGLTGSCADQQETTCPSGLSKCFSLTTVRQTSFSSSKTKAKNCAADCASGAMSFSTGKMSFECCNTDGCNVQDAPDPSAKAPNGKSCYTCDEKSCSNVVNCLGTEDRCINATWSYGSYSAVLKGCSSESLCTSSMSSAGIKDISCCKGNLCNAAPSVVRSFLFLCCALLIFILIA